MTTAELIAMLQNRINSYNNLLAQATAIGDIMQVDLISTEIADCQLTLSSLQSISQTNGN